MNIYIYGEKIFNSIYTYIFQSSVSKFTEEKLEYAYWADDFFKEAQN